MPATTTAQAFREFQYPTSPERPSATFIEDAYRRAVTSALGELTGQQEQEPST
jgi:hypothetical protein